MTLRWPTTTKLYQIEDRTHASRVRVHEQIDGSIKILLPGPGAEVSGDPHAASQAGESARCGWERTEPHPPPPDHPWRDFKLVVVHTKGVKSSQWSRCRNARTTMEADNETGSGKDHMGNTKGIRRPAARGMGEIPVAPYGSSISPHPPQDRTFLFW